MLTKKVQIVQCSSDHYWYKNLIGSVWNVVHAEGNKSPDYTIANFDQGRAAYLAGKQYDADITWLIAKCDAVVITKGVETLIHKIDAILQEKTTMKEVVLKQESNGENMSLAGLNNKMKKMKIAAEKREDNQKVYCSNCIHYICLKHTDLEWFDLCETEHVVKDAVSHKRKLYTRDKCENKNKENNCGNYKRKWWKIVRRQK